MSARLPMVEEPRPDYGAPVPLEHAAYAAKVAYELLAALPPEILREMLAVRAGKEVSEAAAATFLGLLKMAIPCLGLDLVTLAEVRAAKR